VIPLGADRDVFSRTARRDEGPPWRLRQVANLNPVKDHATLLQAVALLRLCELDVRLDLVGLDTLGGAIQTRAVSPGLGEAVTFHGFVANGRLFPHYERAHLYVADFASRRAVAAPPGDAEALAGAIAALLPDPARRARLVASAREWAIAHDADWTAAALADLYAHLPLRAAR
jgi:glycosyltransferase involved in cell wall biosynthesis